MTALPVVVRELSVAARRSGTYWTRIWVVLGAILFGAYELSVFRSTAGWSGGGNLFTTFSTALLVYCLIVSIRNSADCISKEKREGTLGLLFLTDLQGFDVVLGKLFAVGLHSFYGFLGAFPILGISLLLGGVTGTEFWRTSLAILNVLFLGHVIGMTTSVFCLEARRSYQSAAVLTVLLFGAFPGIALALSHLNFATAADLVGIFGPAYPFFNAAGQGTDFYWESLLLTHTIGWCVLGVSSLYLPHSWQERAGEWRRRWHERFLLWSYGSSEVRRAFRNRMVAINPFYWLASRSRLGPRFVWGVLAVFACAWIWIWFGLRTSLGAAWGQWQTPLILGSVCLVHSLVKIWIASESVRHIEQQRRSGSLELLLSCTPLQVSDIIQGQWLALQRLFLWPVVGILMVDFAVIMLSNGAADRTLPGAVGGMMIMLVADAITIGWVGMWLGLSTKKQGHAAGKVIWRILVLPWLIFALFGAGLVFGIGSWVIAFFGWVFLGIGNDLFFGIRAQCKLIENFRALSSPQTQTTGLFSYIVRNALSRSEVPRVESVAEPQ